MWRKGIEPEVRLNNRENSFETNSNREASEIDGQNKNKNSKIKEFLTMIQLKKQKVVKSVKIPT